MRFTSCIIRIFLAIVVLILLFFILTHITQIWQWLEGLFKGY